MYILLIVLYIIDYYTNRIEFSIRHFIILVCELLILAGIYIAVSTCNENIDPSYDWSNIGVLWYMVALILLVFAVSYCMIMVSSQKQKRYLSKPPEKTEKKNINGAIHISLDNS